MKFVIITSSLGIIIKDKTNVKTIFLPLKFNLENANAAGIITANIIDVVSTVNISVFRKYFPNGTAVNA